MCKPQGYESRLCAGQETDSDKWYEFNSKSNDDNTLHYAPLIRQVSRAINHQIGMLGMRVGEASHPGPTMRPGKKQNKQMSGVFEMMQVLLSLVTAMLGPEKMSELMGGLQGGRQQAKTKKTR